MKDENKDEKQKEFMAVWQGESRKKHGEEARE